MANRLDLHRIFETFADHVYYQPPANIKMSYPAIRYTRANIAQLYANNNTYHYDNSYEAIVIDKNPDSKIIDEMLKLPMCKHVRHYVAEGFHHDVFTIYW